MINNDRYGSAGMLPDEDDAKLDAILGEADAGLLDAIGSRLDLDAGIAKVRAEATSGDRVAWPFYLVCDVSASMHSMRPGYGKGPTPYEAMQEALLSLVAFADENVEAADIAYLGVLTFADDAQVVLPLRKMSDGFQVGPLPKGSHTNYAKLFATLSDVVSADLRRLERRHLVVKRPVVFFITDGQPVVDGREQPRELWEPPLRRLHALSVPRPEGQDVPIAVVALGFEGTNSENLQIVAKAPGVACVAEAGTASPYELMADLLTSVLASVTCSTAEGELVFYPPRGMTLCR